VERPSAARFAPENVIIDVLTLPTRLLLACLLLAPCTSGADPAPFDLVGPRLQVTVQHAGQSLPITRVRALAVGDRLQLRAELPSSQSAHYLLVAAFLRGPTNPPPTNWFVRCETWTRSCQQDGISVTVPDGALQLLVFFAPETGGDFKTLVDAVQGRPGSFVRAAQELHQAALDRLRLEQYLNALHVLGETDPGQVKEAAPLLARSLAITVDEKCLDRIPALQAPCLMRRQESLILNDGHSDSVVATLTSGPASDLAMQAGNTAVMNSGAYVPYIGSILDIARLMDGFHTARYQYIPALTMQDGDGLVLMLNTPPSFHKPQSVLVTALAPVDKPVLPMLHAVDSKGEYCARRNPLVLPVEGEPIVFATGYAHDTFLAVTARDGKVVELPAHADARVGGYVVDTAKLEGTALDPRTRATLHGQWGFTAFDGPVFTLIDPGVTPWSLAPGDSNVVVAGRDDTLRLQSDGASCVTDVQLTDSSGVPQKTTWKVVGPNLLELKLPLQDAQPGPVTLALTSSGAKEPQTITLDALPDAGRLDGFTLYAGDEEGVLRGTRLEEVESLAWKRTTFTPGQLRSGVESDELQMKALDGSGVASFKAGDTGKATIKLKDGRSLKLAVTVGAARPRSVLIAKKMQRPPLADHLPIELANSDDVPVDARLTFSVRTQSPAAFAPDETLEIATADGTCSTSLSISKGEAKLETDQVAVASLVPSKALGASAFGPLQFRVVTHGIPSQWQPLATLVRVPVLAQLQCPTSPKKPCSLAGDDLFLIDSVAQDAAFNDPVSVPEGFADDVLSVPHSTDGRLYLKLRDDPTTVHSVRIPPTAAKARDPKAPDAGS
jgi:hypothetical protein